MEMERRFFTKKKFETELNQSENIDVLNRIKTIQQLQKRKWCFHATT